MLDLLLKQDDPERSFVKFKQGDELVLLANNQGGMSVLEMGAVVDETLIQLGVYEGWKVKAGSRLIRRITRHHSLADLQRHLHGLNEHARDLPHPAEPHQRFRREQHLDD